MEITEIESRKTKDYINKTTNCFFEKINKIGKPLDTLMQNREDSTDQYQKQEGIS